MHPARILVIDDEPGILDNTVYALKTEGFTVLSAQTAGDGLRLFRAERPDLVVLDVGLPDGNGFDLCRELRRHAAVPVIFLTARAGEVDRVVGLEIGADDYVVKPFSPRELAARVKAVLRRCRADHAAASPPLPQAAIRESNLPAGRTSASGAADQADHFSGAGPLQTLPPPSPSVSAVADASTGTNPPCSAPADRNPAPRLSSAATPPAFEVDEIRAVIRFHGSALPLSATEYRLLRALCRHPGRVFSRSLLMEAAWEDPAASMERTVDAHIKSLRASLRTVRPDLDPICTHRGMGYSLREEV